MKNKNTAAFISFFGGVIGLHRFYLGQTGLGIFYCILCAFTAGILPFLLGLLDGIIFLSMDERVFNAKYNRQAYASGQPHPDFQRSNRRSMPDAPYVPPQRRTVVRETNNTRKPVPSRSKNNPFKLSGIKKFKEFEIEEAIEDFIQALKIDPADISLHFNLACAYSHIEKGELAYEHLSKAVEMGFDDFEKINTHDALAYVRIQPQWEEFKANGYTLRKQLSAPASNLLDHDLLLEQLKKLQELKEKGLITEREFVEQKTKITRQ